MKRLLMFALAAAALATSAHAWDTRFSVYADSTFAGQPGFLVYIAEADPFDVDETFFLALEDGRLRVLGSRQEGETEWEAAPDTWYLGPAPGDPIGATWPTFWDDLGRPSYSTLHLFENTTVPAGTFNAAMCVVRPDNVGPEGYPISEVRRFVSGVGMIRDYWLPYYEADQLVSYNIVGGSGYLPLAVGNWWEYDYYAGIEFPLTPAGDMPVAGHLLLGNVPNPFNPGTEIQFQMGRTEHARLTIHDLAGHLVRTLVDEQRGEGPQTVWWDGRDSTGQAAAAGVYLYRLEAGKSVQTRRMTLVK